MSRKGLSMDAVIAAATELVEEKGFDQFSLRELAGKLDVKPASLYNHTANVAELTEGVGRLALQTLYNEMQLAGEHLHGKEQIFAIAIAYRHYAKCNPELYKAIANLPSLTDSLKEDAHPIMAALYEMLESFALSAPDKVKFARSLRSAMHGFVSLEAAGYFKNDVDVDKSYQYLVQILLDGLSIQQGAKLQ